VEDAKEINRIFKERIKLQWVVLHGGQGVLIVWVGLRVVSCSYCRCADGSHVPF